MSQIPIQLAIWDFDGTLVHSLPATFKAFNAGLKPILGREFSDAEIMSHFGPPDQEILRTLVGAERAQECYDNMLRHMTANIKDVKVFDGIHDALKSIEGLGVKNAIFTGRGRISTDLIVDALKLHSHFVQIVTNDDVSQHKPHPEGIFQICENINVSPTHAVMIGDSVADVKSGRQAGSYTLGCTWSPHASNFHGVDKRPDRIVAHPKDVVTWLQGWKKT